MDAAQPNDTILLLDNISASTDTFPILAWQEDITLDLNGKTISGSPASSSGDLIQIYRKNVGGENSYGRLTLKDTAGSGEIICEAGGCENVINIRGGDPNVLTMYGGKISGGATNVRVNGNFTMHGGEISGGTTNVNSLGQFTMSGGKISGGTTGVICHTLCSMSGGEISGASGNGVTLDDTSVFNLLGGTISGNGQYAIEAFENSFVFISNGNPIIVSRGSAESSRGIYLHEGSGISIYETPAAGSSIGVTLESGAGVAARGSRSKAPTEDDLAVFSSDEGYAKFLNTTKKAIVFGYQISYDAGGAEGDLPDALNIDPTDTTADPTVPDRGSLTKTGYSFTGWKDEKGNEYAADADFKTLLAQYKPAGSVILTAQWEVNTYAVMLETYGGTINSGDVTQYTYGIGAALPTDVAWDHYSFGGWYENVDFSGDPVELISTSDTGDKTFYAKWIYAVSFDKNASDAQGPLNVSQFFIYNGAEQALLKNSFTREGYIFSGWNTVQDPKTQSGGAWYWDEMSVRNLPGDGIVTLYAQWEPTTVRIRKVDEDGYEIGGAVVSIFETLSGKPFGTEQTYDPARGDVIFEGLSIGVKYTVHEVKAPRGYSLAEDKTFVLDEYGFIDLFSADTTVKLIDGIIFLENEPTKVYVRKTDSQSGARLADAQLQLLNTQDGTVSWTSSGTDDREFSGLATGEEYTLHEAAAPSASYNAADDAVFVLDADGSIDPDLTTADYTMEGNNIILLVENVRLYTITFVNEDDSVLESEKWAYGSTPHYTGTLPEKPADVSHSYTFAGWSPHITTVTGDATYKATYTSELNNYTVRFVDEDGTELQTASYHYGTPAADIALPADPTKTSTAQYDYRFAGWTPDIAAVTGNAEYRASYTPVLRQYTVTFVNEDNSVLESGTWDYGATPHYTGTLPEKPADVSHSYTFAGWDPAVMTVTGDATYKAKYDQTVNTYLVTFVDEDGTELQSDRYAYGTPAADIAQPANPTKTSDAQYTYSFAGWTPAIAEVTGDATYRATYDAVLRQYTVTFLDDDGTELGRDLYPYGTLAADIVRPQDPEKTSDAQYHYTFAGWTPTFANVTGNAVYRASYDAVLRQYTVRFVNEDNTELQSGLWDYGATPVYHGDVPTKPADVSHTYHFAGWDPEIVTVTGDATYTAAYSQTENLYTVTFVDEDGTVLKEATEYPYGTKAADIAEPDDPVKTSTAQYDYTFAGWTPAITDVTGDVTYRATYNAVLRQYTVRFVNEDHTELQSGLWDYGAMPVYHGEVPTKPADVSHSYHFAGWDPEIVTVTGDAVYTAVYSQTENLYKITFVDEDGTVLKETEEYPYGTKAADIAEPDDPVKASTAQYDYTFAGWTPDIVDVTGDATYRATYTAVLRQYTVRFINDDGTTLQSGLWNYGVTPVYHGEVPTKRADVSHSYHFAGWSPAITPVTRNTVYTAAYSQTENLYKVTFVDEDGTVLKEATEYPYGTKAADIVKPDDPVKASTAQYDYTFAGWDPAIADVTEDAVYTAAYTAVLRQYTITFLNEDNTVLQSGLWDYGATPVYHGITPSKPADVSHTYHFAGWDPAITAVTGDATYTAAYSQTENLYTVTFVDEDGTVLKAAEEYPYGTLAADIVKPDDPVKASTLKDDYIFAGWSPDIADVTDDAVYTAAYTAVLRQYTVRFVNIDGSTLQSGLWNYGATPVYHGEVPTKPADASYSYHFTGWNPAITAVTGDATYTAAYSQTENLYTVTFVDEDGTVLKEATQYPYGTKAVNIAKPDDPVKPSTAQYEYTFTGWDPAIADVTADAVYTAAYSAALRRYTITFVNEDNTVLQSGLLDYGAMPVYHGEVPAKPADVSHSYHFAGWDPEIVSVTGDAVYTAVYSQTENLYTVTFVDEDGTVLKEAVEYPYGTKAADIAEPDDPVKPSTAQYDYIFAGWTPSIADVTADAVYTATYTAVLRQYTVTFLNEDGTVLKEAAEYPYGTQAADIVTPDDPVKASTVQYDYIFAGWTPSIADVSEDAVYTAAYTAVLRQYTVTFLNEDYTELQSGLWDYGAMPVYHGEVPAKPADVSHSYHFAGWDPAITAVTGDTFYIATYSQAENLYTVTFVDEDGTVLKEAVEYPYGTLAADIAEPDDPMKPSTAQYDYIFAGWAPDIADVTADAVYTATYKAFLRQYTVRFVNEDGTELESVMWDYGEIPVYTGKTPVKEGESGVVYTFIGWTDGTTDYGLSDSLPAVTGDVTYTARFTSEMLAFTVTWLNWNFVELETDENVPYGTRPSYDGETPTREDADGLVYTFAGWTDGMVDYGPSDPLPAVTADVTYTARFTSETNIYHVLVTSDENGTAYAIPSEGPTGTEVTLFATPNVNCQFVRWEVIKGEVTVNDNKFVIMHSDVEIQAVFEAIENPFVMDVTINNIMGNGSKGAPKDISTTHMDPTVILMSVLHETSGKFNDGITVHPGEFQIKTTVTFANEVPDISSALYEVLVEGLPKLVSSAGKDDNKYLLTYNAWINNEGGITINLIWTDKYYVPFDEVYVFPLPEDEIGAYKMDPWGKKEYLIFHTYEICMRWLGSDELCSGYERCFHKELPYIYDKNKIRYGYDWAQP